MECCKAISDLFLMCIYCGRDEASKYNTTAKRRRKQYTDKELPDKKSKRRKKTQVFPLNVFKSMTAEQMIHEYEITISDALFEFEQEAPCSLYTKLIYNGELRTESASSEPDVLKVGWKIPNEAKLACPASKEYKGEVVIDVYRFENVEASVSFNLNNLTFTPLTSQLIYEQQLASVEADSMLYEDVIEAKATNKKAKQAGQASSEDDDVWLNNAGSLGTIKLSVRIVRSPLKPFEQTEEYTNIRKAEILMKELERSGM